MAEQLPRPPFKRPQKICVGIEVSKEVTAIHVPLTRSLFGVDSFEPDDSRLLQSVVRYSYLYL